MQPQLPSRYASSGDDSESDFVDADRTVLANLLGITDLDTLHRKEEESLAAAYELLLAEVETDTPMTSELIRYIHWRIFGDLYRWGGRWRTVWISKPGVTWPPPDHLEVAMRDFDVRVLSKYPAASLSRDDEFCDAAGHLQGEFLAIHPFREGNARTIKLLTDLLAVQTGRRILLYDASDDGRNRYIAAARDAMLENYVPMVGVFRDALRNARQAT